MLQEKPVDKNGEVTDPELFKALRVLIFTLIVVIIIALSYHVYRVYKSRNAEKTTVEIQQVVAESSDVAMVTNDTVTTSPTNSEPVLLDFTVHLEPKLGTGKKPE